MSELFCVRIVLCQNCLELFCVRVVLCQNCSVSELFCVRIVLCKNGKICTYYGPTLCNIVKLVPIKVSEGLNRLK